MMPSHLIALIIWMLTLGQPDETIRRYGGANHEWQLVTLMDAPFDAKATLQFPARTEVAGSGPCNSFRSTNTTPYPWFEIGLIAATRRACPDLAAERAYFNALRAARIAVIEGDKLTLSDETRVLMIFKARD